MVSIKIPYAMFFIFQFFLETDNPDVKSVVRLLSSALGIDANKAANIVSPKKNL